MKENELRENEIGEVHVCEIFYVNDASCVMQNNEINNEDEELASE